ncbi:hypothetical protein B0H19DRAFT_965393 [Mycena capillaripes]|nr:hypothetical protein B0H19DRAFT_1272382 [Mycena capillaripes]KAJ6533242.1 hypothetical protein B0H19DRAFT_965393 [Mycena capillaripes]
MSIAHLPSYDAHEPFGRSPSYSAEPRLYEQRLALNARSLPQPTGNFLKSSKKGDVTLRLSAQEDNLDLPVYGSGDVVEGTVELTKTDSIDSVELKVEGHLHLKETGEGGHTHYTLCLESALLWKDADNTVCPSSLPFSVTLPTEFEAEGRSHPLPPSHAVKLETMPGFDATVEYSVSVIIDKQHSLVKSKKLGIHLDTTVSTPFIYYPRTRPSDPLPSPLPPPEAGRFIERPDWRVYHSDIKVNAESGIQDIAVKFYFPVSRIFCASQGIPFHLTFESDAHSVAAFLPYAPTADTSGKSHATRIQLMRQSAVDVKQHGAHGTNAAMWRIDYIGTSTFKHAGDGATCMSFSGEVRLQPTKVMGFQVPGLSVQDCILLTVAPPEGTKAPFVGIREVIPVQLTTDAWSEDGRGVAVARRSMSHEKERR